MTRTPRGRIIISYMETNGEKKVPLSLRIIVGVTRKKEVRAKQEIILVRILPILSS
jgi:hypothetical protein